MSAVHVIRDGAFVCLAAPTDSCRNYPACGCETWDADLHPREPGKPAAAGHEDVPQADCWIAPWINASELADSYFGPINHEDVYNDAHGMTFPDGPVDCVWEGEFMQWHYTDDTLPVWEDSE